MFGRLVARLQVTGRKSESNEMKSILKKSGFNFYREYREGAQRKRMEQMKNDSILQERLAQEMERDLM